MNNSNLNKRRLRLAVGMASMLAPLAFSPGVLAQDDNIVEEVLIIGVKQALENALNNKRDTAAILDTINATDIGTLPDNNMAEALQRVPGIQVTRDGTGEGNGFQIRGIAENRVELEGRTILPDVAGDRFANTRSIPSTIIASLDVFKSQSADMTEGSLGGTVVVRTRKPLDTGYALSGQIGMGKDSDVDEYDPKLSFLASNNWDLASGGRFGALINLSFEDYHEASNQIQAPDWQGWLGGNRANLCSGDCQTPRADGGQHGLEDSFFAVPQLFRIQQPYEERERMGIDAIFQWEVNDQLEIGLHLNRNTFDNINSQQRTVVPIRQNGFTRIDVTRPYTVEGVTRGAFGDEFLVRDNIDFGISEGDDVLLGLPGVMPEEDEMRPFIPNGVVYNTATAQPLTTADLVAYTGEVTRGFITAGAATQSRPRFATNFSESEREQWNNAISLKWTGERLTVDAQLSMASSEQTTQNYNFQISTIDNGFTYFDENDVEVAIPRNHPTLFWDFRGGGENVVLDYSFEDYATGGHDLDRNGTIDADEVYDLQNLNSLAFQFMNSTQNLTGPGETQDEDTFRVDFDYEIEAGMLTSIEAGFKFDSLEVNAERHRFRNHNQTVSLPFFLLPEEVQNFYQLDPEPVARDAKGSFLRTWYTPRQPQTFAQIDRITDLVEQRANQDDVLHNYINNQGVLVPIDKTMFEEFSYFYNITEESTALYLKGNLEGDAGDWPFKGDIGLRFVSTDVDSIGADTIHPDYQQYRALDGPRPTLKLTSSYSEVLPSATVSFDVRDDLILRLHGSKRLARADLRDLAPNLQIDVINTRGSRGNPDLEPKTSVNLDSSLEWYFEDGALLSGTLFWVDLSSFFDTAFIIEQYPDAANDNTLVDYLIEQRVNGPSGKTTGFEINYQQSWGYGFGGQINFTYAKSELPKTFLDELSGDVLPLINTSETSYNIVVYWENESWEARMAYNWRDERYSNDTPGNRDPITFSPQNNPEGADLIFQTPVALPIYWEDYGQLDMSIGYHLGDSITFRLNGRNVLENHARQFVGIKNALNDLLYAGARYEFTVTGRF